MIVLSLMFIIAGFSLATTGNGEAASAGAVLAPADADTAGFARAIGPHDWDFPQDFGSHPAYQTEWWYYTGNLAGEDGDRKSTRLNSSH